MNRCAVYPNRDRRSLAKMDRQADVHIGQDGRSAANKVKVAAKKYINEKLFPLPERENSETGGEVCVAVIIYQTRD